MIQIKLNPDRKVWELYFHGALWKEIPNTLFKWKPRFPDCASEEELKVAWEAIEYKRARQYVIRALSRKNYSAKQMIGRLVERGISSATAQKVVLECVEAGYIDDELWLEQMLASMIRKCYGPKKMVQELISKGISPDQSTNLIEKSVGETEVQDMINRLFSKKFHRLDLEDVKQRKKIVDALMRRGFSYQKIREFVDSKL